ncbi:MAG: tetratricopeptide repeat protein, partial [Candidatus Methylomirabilales bacterium]
LAVYGVGRRLGLGRAGAAGAGALFAVHPLHTEVVAGIVGRAELLMALGVLLGFAAYRGAGRLARLGALLAFALGLLAKEQAMVLPALLLLADWLAPQQRSPTPGGRARLRRLLPGATLLRLLPYCGLLGGYLLLRGWVLGGGMLPDIEFLDNPLAHVALTPRLLTALAVAGRYLTLCLWPVPLAPDYSYNQIPLATSLFEGRVLLALLLWGALFALGGRALRRGPPAAAFAVGFTTLTFLPAANLFVPIGTIMGERLFYLPSAGLCWLAGLGWEAAQAKRPSPRLRAAAGAAVGVLLLAGTAQALRYGRVWRDDLTLFSYAVRVAPESARLHYGAGNLLLGLPGRRDEAVLHLLRATEIYPRHAHAWDALGRAYLDMKRWEEAIAAFRKAGAVHPDFPRSPDYPYSQNNLGVAHAALGRWDDALAAFRRAVALKPDLAQAHRNLADVYEQRGWTEAALAERALELTPTDPFAWLQAGMTFLRLGWPPEALGAFAQAVSLAPALPEAHLRLAQAHDLLRHPAEAAAAYEALLRLRPALPAIHRRLAELYSTALPNPGKAAAHRQQAEAAPTRPPGP